MDDLATVSYAGYREVRAHTAEAQQAARRRLLQLVLDRADPVPLRALADLAEVACWPLPDWVIAVAIAPPAPMPDPTLGPKSGPTRGLTRSRHAVWRPVGHATGRLVRRAV